MKLGRYIIGLVSGLTFGMLFAPKKGEKLRQELRKKGAISGHDALAVLVDAFKGAGSEAVSEAKKLSDNEQIAAALSMSKDKMKEYLAHLEDTGYDVAAKAQEKFEELSEMAMDESSAFKQRAVRKKTATVRRMKRKVKSVKKAARGIKAEVKREVKQKIKTTARKVSSRVKSAPKKRQATKKK